MKGRDEYAGICWLHLNECGQIKMHLEREEAECGWIKIDQDEQGLCAVVEKNIERW
jgi:hypothetical protein